jgi:hypothetical protein
MHRCGPDVRTIISEFYATEKELRAVEKLERKVEKTVDFDGRG